MPYSLGVQQAILYYLGLCQVHSMTFARRRNRLTTHFSERYPVVKRRISVLSRFVQVNSMSFAQRRNRLTTHFSERYPVVKRRISVLSRFVQVHSTSFAQRRNRLTTHFSERYHVLKRRMRVYTEWCKRHLTIDNLRNTACAGVLIHPICTVSFIVDSRNKQGSLF